MTRKSGDAQLSEIKSTAEDALKRALTGDTSALPAVREIMDRVPEIARISDLSTRTLEAWTDLSTGKNLLYREALERRLTSLRSELCGPSPAPLERLLVERILVCWVQVHVADAGAAHIAKSIETGTYFQQTLDRAQRRYLHAVTALAQVRRLLIPVVQVNIAKKQVNIAAGDVATGQIESSSSTAVAGIHD